MNQLIPAAALALALTASLAAQAQDIEKGKSKATACAACHNEKMNPLAGRDAESLKTAIKAIRDGGKAHPPLTGLSSDEDIADVAAYLSSQKGK